MVPGNPSSLLVKHHRTVSARDALRKVNALKVISVLGLVQNDLIYDMTFCIGRGHSMLRSLSSPQKCTIESLANARVALSGYIFLFLDHPNPC
jgi:hypothetical protein